MAFTMRDFLSCVVICLSISTLTQAIMVTYGTNKGPIVPRSALPDPKPISTSTNPLPPSPAPVYEPREDLPNPIKYIPLVPHQYRTKLFAVKPSTNLILGTPLDIKYTPSVEKFEIYQKTRLKSVGKAYAGPNLFERQPYEFDVSQNKIKTFLMPSVSYVKPELYERKLTKQENVNLVPEIGIVYSSGVRYYVPQMVLHIVPIESQTAHVRDSNDRREEEEQENSVYDREDQKYFYRT